MKINREVLLGEFCTEPLPTYLQSGIWGYEILQINSRIHVFPQDCDSAALGIVLVSSPLRCVTRINRIGIRILILKNNFLLVYFVATACSYVIVGM
jgi:hypothetical protein